MCHALDFIILNIFINFLLTLKIPSWIHCMDMLQAKKLRHAKAGHFASFSNPPSGQRKSRAESPTPKLVCLAVLENLLTLFPLGHT